MAAKAEEPKKNYGYVPAEYVASKLGEKVVTPNGLVYEPLELGTAGTSLRDGPPRSGSAVWVKYKGHVDSFEGPVFDSSEMRSRNRPDKPDYVEIRLNLEPTMTNGMFEALKLMKVGGKGRFTQPPVLSYGEGKVAIDADEGSQVKKVPAESTLYYEVELVRIIKP